MRIIISQILLFICISANAQTAKEIIQKAEENARGVKTSQSNITITIVRPKWTRDMSLKTWSKGQKYSLILITDPVKEKGNTFLKRDKEIWYWVPAIERTIKMPPSMMMQSWMGTDFTNDDLVRESSTVNDYTHRIVSEESIDGRNCYKIELTSKPDAPVVWGKINVWIDKKDFIQLRAEMFDEDGQLINVMLSSELKNIGGRLLPTIMELIPQDKKGHKTIMKILFMEFDKPISDDFFTIQNMKKVK
ncbi:outer membrane lipoprotein-sorting protein [Solitalea lacus]|uniref:outer membrane lipoprotein-sorting protein n=1 Tax=Solitalea lacus TaxID=2911172 RepID=UPI001EDC595D|nr:outer membrane lipoprotein-sorting protein [Solitalea lacus]UKJ06710.1 outer membrane lipoprotein-sorting protein [Solitalea lacus]